MKFEIQRHSDTGKITFSGEVEKVEVERLRLNPADRALLTGPKDSPADQLLTLEMLYRRHVEQAGPRAAGRDKPYAGVICRGGHGEGIPACGKVGLTQREYDRQMDRPDRGWHCPRCGGLADFDDERFEELQGIAQQPPTLTQGGEEAVEWHVVDECGGLIANYTDEASAREVASRWENRGSRVRPLIYGDTAPPSAPVEAEVECQVHREAHLRIDNILMGAGVFEVEHAGGTREAWKNTIAAVRALAKQPASHPDDTAVDAFAIAMKEKLAAARAKGRGGWDGDEPGMQQRLSDMLRAHVVKGDPRDVANFAMFLHQRGEPILPAKAEKRAPVQRYHGKTIPWHVHGLAWEAYAKEYGTSQSAERIAERGGFGIGEMDRFLPGWRGMAEGLQQPAAVDEAVGTVTRVGGFEVQEHRIELDPEFDERLNNMPAGTVVRLYAAPVRDLTQQQLADASAALAAQPAAVDGFDLDCPHSAIGGCDLCAAQPGGSDGRV